VRSSCCVCCVLRVICTGCCCMIAVCGCFFIGGAPLVFFSSFVVGVWLVRLCSVCLCRCSCLCGVLVGVCCVVGGVGCVWVGCVWVCVCVCVCVVCGGWVGYVGKGWQSLQISAAVMELGLGLKTAHNWPDRLLKLGNNIEYYGMPHPFL